MLLLSKTSQEEREKEAKHESVFDLRVHVFIGSERLQRDLMKASV